MLAIRMQRTGRKGHAMFRVVVQDARRTPTSGKVVAQLGSYDPHNKSLTLNKEKAGFYLEHGAQPSDRVAVLLKQEGVKLPKWVKMPDKKEQKVRNPEKRRSTKPDEPAEEPATEEAPAEEASVKEATSEEPIEEAETAKTEEPSEEPAEAAEEKPAEEPAEKPEEKQAEASEAEKPKDEKTVK